MFFSNGIILGGTTLSNQNYISIFSKKGHEMITNIGSFTIVVPEQDEALEFYVHILGFEKRTDMPMESGKRWITVAPPDAQVVFVLQPLDWFEGEEREEHKARIGKASTVVLYVDDCKQTYVQLSSRGVEFTKVPIDTSYGVEAICKDLYGNTFVLLERPLLSRN